MTSRFKHLFSCPTAPFSSLQTRIFCVLHFFFTSSWTYVLSSLLKRDPHAQGHGAGTEIHLSIQPSVHSFFHSVSTMCLYQAWTCLGFQHSVIIQYNFLVVQLEIWDKRPFQTEMSIMAGSISFPLMKYLRMIKHEIDTISCFLCTNVSLPPCLISSMFRHAGGICSFLWVVSRHKVSGQLIVGWLCPRN